MKVKLSGFNFDRDNSENFKTPETICAAYARISRSEKSIEELRREASEDIENARRSNEKIVFQLGHSSIAEHAVFNFDLTDISRFSIEYIQHHRLASFTEKSQRYVNMKNGYLIPEEIEHDRNLKTEYLKFCEKAFSLYKESLEFLNTQKDKQTSNEDSRYFLPLSTLTQCGMTLNGRTLEYMIARLKSQNIVELSKIASELERESVKLAPSIIKYTEGNEKFKNYEDFPAYKLNGENVKILNYTKNFSDLFVNSFLFHKEGKRFSKKKFDKTFKEQLIDEIFKNLKSYDKPPREFELADYTFRIICSSSCFAQLKRHRIATIITQAYSTISNPVVPHTLKKTKFENDLLKLQQESNLLAKKLYKKNPLLCNYAVLNATKRSVILKMNAREIYHFVRLRSDKHAQWEIREISDQITQLLKEKEPIMFKYLSGKDEYLK
ncbi:MAG: FAD-dependent thymidylate synthase [candidate division WOR-3 bacterium]